MASFPFFAALGRAFRKHDGGRPAPCPYSIGDVATRAPWETAFVDRLAEFLSDPGGRRTVVFVADAPNASTFRYRIYNIRQCLGRSPLRICFFYRSELPGVEAHLGLCDLVVLQRVKWTGSLQRTIDRIRALGIPLAYDVDDLICCLDAFPLVAHALNLDLEDERKFSFWMTRVARGEMVARQCDAFIATNRFLADWLSRAFGGKPGHVIENGLNREQLEVSERILRQKRGRPARAGEFVIGYFSGTKSHGRDFEVLAPELARFLRDCPSARLVVVGFMDFPDDLRPFLDAGRVAVRPLVDFLRLQAEMAAVDVSVVPLVENAFTHCKSELKYFEAAAVETLTAASPTYAYAHAIRQGETGFLCRKGEWYPTLARLAEGKCDIAGLAEKARRDCLARYSGEAYARRAEEVLASLLRT